MIKLQLDSFCPKSGTALSFLRLFITDTAMGMGRFARAVIQTRNIEVSTEDEFRATYKGKQISITTDHGFGKPKYEHLKRFMIDVIDIETGMVDVQSYEDFHEIKDAIRSALKGACLIS